MHVLSSRRHYVELAFFKGKLGKMFINWSFSTVKADDSIEM